MLLDEIRKKLKERPLIYVTRELERANGFGENIDSYMIIANDKTDTHHLVIGEEVEKAMSKTPEAEILVFKNSLHLERVTSERGWKIINPSAELSNKIEDKITQTIWLSELAIYLPPHHLGIMNEIAWTGSPFILQWNHAHTGEGTFFIEGKKQLDELSKRFPNREVKTSEFIEGPVFTNNIVIAKDKIFYGNISRQITGESKLTDNKFSTVGNDWSDAVKLLDDLHKKQYSKISKDVAEKMEKEGWRGMFGLDIALDITSDKLYLLEINARQVASACYESELQRKERENGTEGITIFEAHIAALLELDLSEYDLIEIKDGKKTVSRK